MTEERLNKIAHDTAHRLSEIYKIAKDAMNIIDEKFKQILLDKQELEKDKEEECQKK